MITSWPRTKKTALCLVGAAIAAFLLFPYLVMFLTALKNNNELITVPPRFLPSQWEWSNFVDAFSATAQPIADNLKVSLIVAVASTAVTMIAALPAAYYTARYAFRGRRLFMNMLLVTQMLSPIVLLVGIYREFLAVSLIDNYWSLVIANAAFNLAFTIWILNAYFQHIPRDLEEAAWVDGHSRFSAMMRIGLPLALPGIVTAVVFCFIAAWNEYSIALTLISTPSRQPLTLGVTSFIGLYQTQWQYLFAVSLIAIVPVVVLFAFIEKHLVGGLTAGGVR